MIPFLIIELFVMILRHRMRGSQRPSKYIWPISQMIVGFLVYCFYYYSYAGFDKCWDRMRETSFFKYNNGRSMAQS